MSGTSEQRRQTPEQRRTEILQAAVRLFCEKGYEGTTIRDIARAVGVTEGLLYHYFPSKAALIEACWHEHWWHPRAVALLQQAAERPLSEVLHDLIRDHLATLRENAPGFRMHAAEMLRDSELASISRRYISETVQAIVEYLVRQQAANRIRADLDPRIVADVILGTDTTFFVIHGRLSDAEWESRAGYLAAELSRLLARSLEPPCHVSADSSATIKESSPCRSV